MASFDRYGSNAFLSPDSNSSQSRGSKTVRLVLVQRGRLAVGSRNAFELPISYGTCGTLNCKSYSIGLAYEATVCRLLWSENVLELARRSLGLTSASGSATHRGKHRAVMTLSLGTAKLEITQPFGK